MEEADLTAIRDLLLKFQDGYKRRDTALLDDFRNLFVNSPDVEVIGTNALVPGEGEWCLGPEATCALVQGDWEGWGDLVLDLAGAHIHRLGDVAWMATTGTVMMDLEPEETYQDYLDYIREQIADDKKLSPRERVLEVLRGGTNTLFEAERGKKYIWPLRFTAVMVKQGDDWLFHQVQFSFATTRFPDVRNT